MTPTIVLKDDKVRFVLGSPGGGRIITTVANIFLSAADEGLNIQEAVDAPRFHHQYLPDILFMEPGFSDSTVEGLRALATSSKSAATGATENASPSILRPATSKAARITGITSAKRRDFEGCVNSDGFLIFDHMALWQHALMKNPSHPDTRSFLAVENHVASVFHATVRRIEPCHRDGPTWASLIAV